MRNFNSQEGILKPILRIKIAPEGLSILDSGYKNVQSRANAQTYPPKLIIQISLIFLDFYLLKHEGYAVKSGKIRLLC